MGSNLRVCVVHVAIVGLACGCSEAGPKPVAVSGNILFDNKPMTDGVIYFQPANGGVPVPGKIEHGRYSLQALPGEYRVVIQQDRDSGTKNVYGQPQMKSMVAPRYNVESVLKATVNAEGANKHSFEVHSN